MCGIFGFSASNKITAKDRIRLQTALCLLGVSNDERGGHSFGAYIPGKAELIRGLGRISGRISWARMAAQQSIFAHTRFATKGEVCKPNSHPFALGDLVGAHNGIVGNWRDIERRTGQSFPVDSQYLLSAIADNAPTEEISAYGAIEYCRADNPGSIKLCRFNGGELAIAECNFGVIWSSSSAHLVDALELSGIDFIEYGIAQNKVYSAESGQLFKTGSHHKFAKYVGYSWNDTFDVNEFSSESKAREVFEEEDYAQWSANRDRHCADDWQYNY